MSYRKSLQNKFRTVKKKYLEEHPYCEIDLLLGKEIPATDVHHITARWDTEKYLDPNNLVALCHYHHLVIHHQAGGLKEQKMVEKLLEKIKERKDENPK